MDICEPHRKHLLRHWLYCCTRVFRALPTNGFACHNIHRCRCEILRWLKRFFSLNRQEWSDIERTETHIFKISSFRRCHEILSSNNHKPRNMLLWQTRKTWTFYSVLYIFEKNGVVTARNTCLLSFFADCMIKLCTETREIWYKYSLNTVVNTLWIRVFVLLWSTNRATEEYCLLGITICIPLKVNGRFGGIYRLHLQSRIISRAGNRCESRWQAWFLARP
jgi:hypothetical protein